MRKLGRLALLLLKMLLVLSLHAPTPWDPITQTERNPLSIAVFWESVEWEIVPQYTPNVLAASARASLRCFPTAMQMALSRDQLLLGG